MTHAVLAERPAVFSHACAQSCVCLCLLPAPFLAGCRSHAQHAAPFLGRSVAAHSWDHDCRGNCGPEICERNPLPGCPRSRSTGSPARARCLCMARRHDRSHIVERHGPHPHDKVTHAYFVQNFPHWEYMNSLAAFDLHCELSMTQRHDLIVRVAQQWQVNGEALWSLGLQLCM